MKTVQSADAALSTISTISTITAITAVTAVAVFATFAALLPGLLGAPAFAQAPVIAKSHCQLVWPHSNLSCCPPVSS